MLIESAESFNNKIVSKIGQEVSHSFCEASLESEREPHEAFFTLLVERLVKQAPVSLASEEVVLSSSFC